MHAHCFSIGCGRYRPRIEKSREEITISVDCVVQRDPPSPADGGRFVGPVALRCHESG
ncbi:hypothetical protein RESH_04390 [Rhodopirellula europaea SH398]|uniref:Uncharacterized protein n=1 Tax=Rhodopirellula europaea SH398 TaxID=1263868 RepID=M5SBG6_9BACT|nr:hypothetical protein RESH_04390 [Rhodopirellula europaea SH398]